MITRRDLVASGLSLAALSSCPAIAARGAERILVVDPALLTNAPPASAIAASGHALLVAMLPRMERWHRLDGFVGEADAVMLAELMRFVPDIRWTASLLPKGSDLGFGRFQRAARRIEACRKS